MTKRVLEAHLATSPANEIIMLAVLITTASTPGPLRVLHWTFSPAASISGLENETSRLSSEFQLDATKPVKKLGSEMATVPGTASNI